MAKKASAKSKAGGSRPGKKSGATGLSQSGSQRRGGSSRSGGNAGDAFIKLLQSPLAAELVAVAATAALAALAEHGFTSGGGASRGKRAGRAVKEAGKAAAAAVGRRLGTEVEEIRKAAKGTKGAKSADARA